MTSSLSIKAAFSSSFRKAFLAMLIFLFLGIFQGKNVIREQVEDVGFDVMNKIFSTFNKQVGYSNSNKVTVFAFDNDYMHQNSLYDENGVNTFGYSFPRVHIAQFIENLDRNIERLKQENNVKVCPKAVFIDIDTSYPSGADMELSAGDNALISTLAAPPRCYKILLARTSKYNFIENEALENPVLQVRLNKKNPSIMFVSPDFHVGGDNIIRRNAPIKSINNIQYPSAAITLWQLMKYGKAGFSQVTQFPNDVEQSEKPQKELTIYRTNVNANRIWFRHYQAEPNQEPKKQACEQVSHWINLKKISLSCSFVNDIPGPQDLDNTVLLLGSTEQESSQDGLGENDYHKVLQFITDHEMSGVDIHANALMTLLHLDSNNGGTNELPILMQLPWYKSLAIVFITLFLTNLMITWLLSLWKINGKQVIFIASVGISTVVFFALSLKLLLSTQPVWFNWVIGFILLQLVEVVFFLREHLPTLGRYLLQRFSRLLKIGKSHEIISKKD